MHWDIYPSLPAWELWEKDTDNSLTLKPITPAGSELQAEGAYSW